MPNVAARARAAAIAEGATPEEAEAAARAAAREAIEGDPIAAVGEKAFQDALNEGASREEAAFRARAAVEKALQKANQRGPDDDTQFSTPADGPGALTEGELANVAARARAAAIADGATPEQAEAAAGAAVEAFKGAFGGGDPTGRLTDLPPDGPDTAFTGRPATEGEVANVAARARAAAIADGATPEQAEAAAGDAIEAFKGAFGGGDPAGRLTELPPDGPDTAFSGRPATEGEVANVAARARAAAIADGATTEQAEAVAGAAVEAFTGAFRGGDPNAQFADGDPAARLTADGPDTAFSGRPATEGEVANVAARARAAAIADGATREQAEGAAGAAVESFTGAVARGGDPNAQFAGRDPAARLTADGPDTAFSGRTATEGEVANVAARARAAAIDSGATREQAEVAADAATGVFSSTSNTVTNTGTNTFSGTTNTVTNTGTNTFSGTTNTVTNTGTNTFSGTTNTVTITGTNTFSGTTNTVTNTGTNTFFGTTNAVTNTGTNTFFGTTNTVTNTGTNNTDTSAADAAAIANAAAIVQAALLLAQQTQPDVKINDVSVFEEGTDAIFTVDLSSSSTNTITVDFATSADTAISGVDYTTTNGTLTFAPGQTTQTFSVPIISDSGVESTERVTLNLFNPNNANITDTSGTLTILDNDLNLTNGVVNFSGQSFPDSGSLVLATGANVRQTLTVDATTSFGSSKLVNFTVGSGITTDVFDYNSALFAGSGASQPVATILGLTEVAAVNLATTVISNDSNAVIDFETSRLSVDFTENFGRSSSNLLADIIKAAEELLESTNSATNLTATNSPVTNGSATSDALLVFYEASGQGTTEDAVIIRYKEGAIDTSFDNELSVVAIFEGISSGSFDSANIV